MATLVDRLKFLFRGPSGDGGYSAFVKVGTMQRFSATAWDFARVANSVYGNPTGYRCIDGLAKAMSRPAFRVKTPGTDDPLEKHPMLDMLNRPWPGVMSGTMMQFAWAMDMELTGKTFWLKMQGRDGFGRSGPVSGLRRMACQRMTVIGDQDDNLVGFIYQARDGQRVPILPENVLYLRYPHPERYYDGMAPAIMAGLAAETDSSAQRFNYDLLSNDAALPGFIAVKGLTEDRFREFVFAWESKENPGKMRFLGGDATFQKVGQTNQELAYTDLREASQKDIMKAFGCPPVIVFDVTNETYANADAELAAFWQMTVSPKLALWSDELTIQIGEKAGVDIDFDLTTVQELQEAETEVVTRNVQLLDRSVKTINEVRKELRLDPVAWGDQPVVGMGPMKPAFGQPAQTIEGGRLPSGQPVEPDADDEPTKKAGMARVVASMERLEAAAIGLGVRGRIEPAEAQRRFEMRASPYRARVERSMIAYFERQARVLDAKVRGLAGKAGKAADVGRWFDKTRWQSELADIAHSFISDTVDAFGTHTMVDLQRSALPHFNPHADVVKGWISGRATDIAGLINDTTEADLRAALADAEAQGWGIDEIARAIAGYFETRGRQRAELVARTEVATAANRATLEAAKQSGVAQTKTWLTAADDRVEPDCEALDGETVGIDEAFSSGDDAPPDHPDCRCTLLINADEGSP